MSWITRVYVYRWYREDHAKQNSLSFLVSIEERLRKFSYVQGIIRTSYFHKDKKILITLKIGRLFELMAWEKSFKRIWFPRENFLGVWTSSPDCPCLLPLISWLVRLMAMKLNTVQSFKDFIHSFIHPFIHWDTQVQDAERWGQPASKPQAYINLKFWHLLKPQESIVRPHHRCWIHLKSEKSKNNQRIRLKECPRLNQKVV